MSSSETDPNSYVLEVSSSNDADAASSTIPDVSKAIPVSEVVPNISSPIAGSEPILDVSEAIKNASEPIPDATEVISKVTEAIPDVSKAIPKVSEAIFNALGSEAIQDVSDSTPDFSETISDATGSVAMPAPSSVASTGNSTGEASGTSFSDLITRLEGFTPAIPDSVTAHLLSTAGLQTDDPRVVRLASLAAQKFVCDIANDALQHYKVRGARKKNGDGKLTLTTEYLSKALSDHGITLKKPPFYV